MKLKKPDFPEVSGTATYFFVHAGHRETAIECAIGVIVEAVSRTQSDDPIMATLEEPIGRWVIESLLQGAWMREYHEWEKATKSYFDAQHERNKSPKTNWKGAVPGLSGASSHVDRVRAEISLFGAAIPAVSLEVLDKQRRLINSAKHEEEYFATEEDYRALTGAVAQFWDALDRQETFTPP